MLPLTSQFKTCMVCRNCNPVFFFFATSETFKPSILINSKMIFNLHLTPFHVNYLLTVNRYFLLKYWLVCSGMIFYNRMISCMCLWLYFTERHATKNIFNVLVASQFGIFITEIMLIWINKVMTKEWFQPAPESQ